MSTPRPIDAPNVLGDGKYLYSRNLVPGNSVYGERLVDLDGTEYRLWDPRRSKFAAYGLATGTLTGIRSDDVVVYLGASTGTTLSHISDIVDGGRIFAIEKSKRTFRELMSRISPRKNVLPVLGDAREEDILAGIVAEADFLYSDIAQRDQVDIFLSNMEQYRCPVGMLMLKCRSIDVAATPSTVLDDMLNRIKLRGFRTDRPIDLNLFEKDHYAIGVRRETK